MAQNGRHNVSTGSEECLEVSGHFGFLHRRQLDGNTESERTTPSNLNKLLVARNKHFLWLGGIVLRVGSQLTRVVRPPGIGLSRDRAVSDAV